MLFPSRDRRLSLYLGLAIFLIAFALRVWAISVPLNLDEVAWLRRGAAFAREILANDLDSTYGRHHPGVTNMWLTGWAMTLNCVLQTQFPQWFQLSQPFPDLETCLRFEDYSIHWFLLPRLVQALVTAATTVGIFVLLRRLFDLTIALSAIALLSLEPFFLGYQRFLTTDALSLNFAILSLLWLLLYLRSPLKTPRFPHSNRALTWLLASGVAMGFAAASKITILFLLPGVWLWVACIELGWWNEFPKRGLWRLSLEILLWVTVFCTTAYLLWPILWVEPGETLVKLYEGLVKESARGHFFFLGNTTDEVGLLFYPLMLLYRLSPILLGGTAISLTLLAVPRWRRQLPHPQTLLALLLVAVSMLGIFSLFSNKLDRYLLPVVPPFAVLAAAGWWTLGRRFLSKATPQVLLSLIAVQAVVLLSVAPHYVTYYNPLLGGNRAARHVLQLGQGEGLEAAARWLNAQSPSLRVASWYEVVFRAYFNGDVVEVGRSRDDNTPPDWTQAHRVVLYINQIQRQFPSPEMVAYFRQRPPLHTVRLQGIEYAWVYPGPVPSPEDLGQIVPVAASDNPVATLLGTDPIPTSVTPGTPLELTTYWRWQQPPPPDLQLQVTLGDRSQTFPLLGGFLFPQQSQVSPVLRDSQILAIPNIPGTYPLRLALMQNGRPLGSPVDLEPIIVP